MPRPVAPKERSQAKEPTQLGVASGSAGFSRRDSFGEARAAVGAVFAKDEFEAGASPTPVGELVTRFRG